MKTAIVYYSKHHGNTKMLIDAIAKSYEVQLIDAENSAVTSLLDYDMIGFASGVYFSSYHKSVLEFAEKYLPTGKKVFFIHTGGLPIENNNAAIKKITDEKNSLYLGTYYCKGYDTYGPFKLVGGVAKGHPDSDDINGAVEFYKSLLK